MTGRNVVDSSAWLEYLADTGQAAHFEAALEDPENLIVPVITIYEVFKKVLRERGESEAMQVASQMQAHCHSRPPAHYPSPRPTFRGHCRP